MYSSQQDRKITSEVKQLMVKTQCEAWLKIKTVLNKHLQSVPQLNRDMKFDLGRNIDEIKNILVLTYFYSLENDFEEYKIAIRRRYISLKENNKQCLQFIKNWLQKQTLQVQSQTIELIIQTLSGFYHKTMRLVKQQDVQFLLYCFNLFSIKSERDITVLVNFMSSMQQIQISTDRPYQSKETILIKLICKILEEGNPQSGNMGILFDEYLIGRDINKHLENYCSFYYDHLINLDEEMLLKIFKQLTKASINRSILFFIKKLTEMLVQAQQFYKIRHLYQYFILTDLARRSKCCTKEDIDKLTLQICQFYVFGFLTYCDIGKAGIQCLLVNCQLITSQSIKNKWIGLAFFTAQKSELKSFIYKYLQNKIKKDVLQLIDSKKNMNHQNIWQITARNIKKHKVYKEYKTNLKGIVNPSCQCYIISVVQALFMTKNFRILIKDIQKQKNKYRAVDDLAKIFKTLEQDSLDIPIIDDLKFDGPQLFRDSKNQQDAHQYMIMLIEQFERELTEEKLFNDFKKIFEIKKKQTIICDNCNSRNQSEVSQFIHTISHKQVLSIENQQEINDFKCDKCKQKKSKKIGKIIKMGQIFIVHINRFSSINGTLKKQFPTQKIMRRFDNYDLVGMIFHIGRQMGNGHYVYYSRVNESRWAKMSDQNVVEFELTAKNQQFQKQLKAEHTPYLLFYKKIK